MTEGLKPFRADTVGACVELIGEPEIVYTRRGFAPVVEIRDEKTREKFVMFLSSKSLAEGVQKLLEANKNLFSGIRIHVKKESDDRYAQYVITDISGDKAVAEAVKGTAEPEKPGFVKPKFEKPGNAPK